VVTNDSIKLAQLWIELKEMKDKLDNEILPVSGHLGLEDPELMIAMEQLSEKIGNHFNRFKLVAETKKNQQKTAQ
jgi:hypothetical protein